MTVDRDRLVKVRTGELDDCGREKVALKSQNSDTVIVHSPGWIPREEWEKLWELQRMVRDQVEPDGR